MRSFNMVKGHFRLQHHVQCTRKSHRLMKNKTQNLVELNQRSVNTHLFNLNSARNTDKAKEKKADRHTFRLIPFQYC